MKLFYLSILIFFCIQSCLAQNTPVDSINRYSTFKILNINYNGPTGNTLGIEYGKLKLCVDCKNTHRKFFGFGIALGYDKQNEFFLGPTLSYLRGEGFMALKGTIMLYSSFNSTGSVLKNPSYLFRPEFLIFPSKNRRLSFGVSYNFHRAIEAKNRFYSSFGVLSFNLAYQIPLKKYRNNSSQLQKPN